MVVIVNIGLLGSTYLQENVLVGTVERNGISSTTYIKQFRNSYQFKMSNSDIHNDRMQNDTWHYTFEFSRLERNRYLLVNEDDDTHLSRHRIFELDNTCSLVFRGPEKNTSSNVMLFCQQD
ncbi:hypothetical protein ABT56_03485 [Photobacterium aquae]|uniref:Uncharacterized protein n=1 Tax=Photobacterium aquae TaxID=1195763 RepID=A0A0J1HC69_9GAMM|nr:hypothetical protein ABT56_03485 [Photobacterium aquae]